MSCRLLALGVWVSVLFSSTSACTNLLIPAGSSTDGSTIIAANADGKMQVGAISHWPAQEHAPGELRPTYDWDFGQYLGAIPQPPQTYNVVGNTNEHQLTITETTFGGLEMLDGTGGRAVCDKTFGCLDYGQIEWVTLARAKTAREAITVIDTLLQTYGYASTGESYSIADPNEVWVMEVIGKGNISKGAVWVATRIPDGSVSAHANQARTRDFPQQDPEHFRHSPDVVTFAREQGLFDGADRDFSFSDTYDPVTFAGARFCEARVYTFFASVAAPHERIDSYLDYVQGRNFANRMPLYVQVKQRISVNDTFWHFRNHYEGTPMDASSDIGAGEWRSPIRIGNDGSLWKHGGKTYFNERPISVPFTHWTQVAVQRPHHPYGVVWFGVDDSAFAARAPFYGVSSRVPRSWDDGNCTQRDSCREALGLPGTMTKFSFQSMFWVCNLVANYVYTRYDLIAPVVYNRLAQIEARLQAALEEQDRLLLELDSATAGGEAARAEAATAFSFREAERLHQEWLDFYGELFASFVDGYRVQPLRADSTPSDKDFGFDKQGFEFRQLLRSQIAATTGDRFEFPVAAKIRDFLLAAKPISAKPKAKHCLKAFGGSPGNCHVVEADEVEVGALAGAVGAVIAIAVVIVGFLVGLQACARGECGGVRAETYAVLA